MYPQAVQIGCELEDLQKAVGGDIEATYPFNEPVALVMHDEGKVFGVQNVLRIVISGSNPVSYTHLDVYKRQIPISKSNG